jgi:PAS domain S-box-containing protein
MSFVTIFRSAFFFLCFLFSLLGYTAYQLNKSIDRKDDALRHQEELRFLGESLAKGSDYLTAEVRNYVQFGNKLHYDNFWKEVNKTRSRDRVVEKLKILKVFPENLKYIEIAKEYSDNLIKTEKEAMNEVEAGNYRAAKELVFGQYYSGQKKLIMENIENFQMAINKIAFDRTREAESNAELFLYLTNGLLILSVLLVLLFFYFIGIKQLVQPMNSLTSLILKMVQGHLDDKVPNISQNQNNVIGAMASTLEFLKSSLIKQSQAEESVQKERQRFLNMLDQLPVSFHLQASDYTVRFANQMFRNRFGDPESGKCYQLMHKREIPCEPCPTFKHFNARKTESSIWNSKDNKTYLSVVTPFDDVNGENLLMEMSIDVTKEQNYRKSQIQSEDRFRTIFEESPLGIALIDSLTGHIYEVNPKLADIAGRSSNEMKTIDWMSITHPDDIQEVLDNMLAMNTGKINGFNMEKRYLKQDNTIIWINLTVTRVNVDVGNKPLHLAMIEDVTKKKDIEGELKRYQDHLEDEINRRTLELKNSQDQLIHSEKLSTLGTFAGTVAHEFNNPLFGLINLVDQLGDELKEEERKKYSKLAQKVCWRMADMIKNLQSFYKPSEGVFSPSEIDEMIEEVLLIVAKACEIKGIQINKIYNTDIFSFEVIKDQITQVMLNILQNSIDSISEDEGKITLTLDRTNSNLILKVQDTGEGIKTENLKFIFDPFFTTKGQEGTGLGLSVSYGIVKSHGGEIVIESELGIGSTITLTLPIARKI